MNDSLKKNSKFKECVLVYPHQLWLQHPHRGKGLSFILIEDPLFFKQYPFHKQKLLLHRASMKAYAKALDDKGEQCFYIESEALESSESVIEVLSKHGVERCHVVDPVDDWLRSKITDAADSKGIVLEWVDSPNYYLTAEEAREFFAGRKRHLQHDLYVSQRKRLQILVDENGEPTGGQWSFDEDNRKKLPKNVEVPPMQSAHSLKDEVLAEAVEYVEENFPNNPGDLDRFVFPVTRRGALSFLKKFFEVKFQQFGSYQDAIDQKDSFLFHSVLSSSINIGLLQPDEVVEKALEAAEEYKVPLNALEGFVRQLIGWREYVRALYEKIGRKQRTKNFFGFERAIPSSFWDGTTGIPPVDDVINRVNETCYANHIERLMVLGNFMLLCEFNPDEVYEWFMALFIDSYDWVMVPNVYGMSQYADGGMIVTKPYISSSNYIRKMSHYKKGEWADVWDGLYWRFLWVHGDLFKGNPRMRMMLSQLNKMSKEKREGHLAKAEEYLSSL